MALRDQPYLPLYVQDFLTDEKLNMCSPSTQGIYIKMMCLFHKSENYGGILLKQKDKQKTSNTLNFAYKFAKLLPFDLDTISAALNELLDESVLKIDGDFLFQKRMVKDNAISIERSKSGKKGGEKTQKNNKEFAKAKPKANSENENEYENEDESKDKKEIVFPFNSEKFKNAWNIWKEYKKTEHGFKYKSKITEQAALNKLTKLSGGIENNCYKILQQSIENGYKGFFEVKQDKNNSTQMQNYKQQIVNEINEAS